MVLQKEKQKKMKEAKQAVFLKDAPLISNSFDKLLDKSEMSIANVSSHQSSSNEDELTTGLLLSESVFERLQTQSGQDMDASPARLPQTTSNRKIIK